MSKVSVICLCHNQAQYIHEALNSVLAQSYKDWELIIVDDASTDNSLWTIEQYKLAHPEHNIKTIFLSENLGNCRAFNQAFFQIKSDYVIDLAADDVLYPSRIEEGVKNLDLNGEVALNFSNAELIDEKGVKIRTHYPIGPLGRSEIKVPEGQVFEEVIKRYFICPPSTMIRTNNLKEIGGYDDNLAYEDFDLYIKLSKKHKFSYTDKVLVKKRIIQGSWSTKQYHRSNGQLASTLKICYKVYDQINSKAEKNALLFRIAYESKQALFNFRMKIFLKFCSLGVKTLVKK